MAQTSVQSNNKAVRYRGRVEREMPSVSRAQNRFMHAAAGGKVRGVPRAVGKKFVKADAGRKIGKMPAHVKAKAKKLRKAGTISDRAAKKHGFI